MCGTGSWPNRSATKAAWFSGINMPPTHSFQSRLKEKGRTEESCEWSLAMAMSDLDVPVFPWINGHTSAQMDYIADLTTHDHNFEQVSCRLYTSPLVHALRGIRAVELRRVLTRLLGIFPGKDEYMEDYPAALCVQSFGHGCMTISNPVTVCRMRCWLRA